MKKISVLLLTLSMLFLIGGPLRAEPESEIKFAVADIVPFEEEGPHGTAFFIEQGDKVLVAIRAHGLTNPLQGVHIHEHGDLSSPTASGAHFNPEGVTRGHPLEDETSQAADLLNLVADDEGRGIMVMEKDNISLSPGPYSIIDRSVIIHAEEDPFIPEDIGGARVAGGIIELIDRDHITGIQTTAAPDITEKRTIEVELKNFEFDPAEIRVKPGAEIEFVLDNPSSAYHTFTVYQAPDDRDQPLVDVSLSAGEQKTVTVTMPEEDTELYLVCLPHEEIEMTGSIIVGNPAE